jgi:hypothetical protein
MTDVEKTVVNLDDMRALREMGLPPDTPVETRTFTAEFSKRWQALHQARDDFEEIVMALWNSKRTRESADNLFDLFSRKLRALHKEMTRCSYYVRERTNDANNSPDDSQPSHEAQLMGNVLVEQAMPYLEYWYAKEFGAIMDGQIALSAEELPTWTSH